MKNIFCVSPNGFLPFAPYFFEHSIKRPHIGRLICRIPHKHIFSIYGTCHRASNAADPVISAIIQRIYCKFLRTYKIPHVGIRPVYDRIADTCCFQAAVFKEFSAVVIVLHGPAPVSSVPISQRIFICAGYRSTSGRRFPVHRRPPACPTHFQPAAFRLVPGSVSRM